LYGGAARSRTVWHGAVGELARQNGGWWKNRLPNTLIWLIWQRRRDMNPRDGFTTPSKRRAALFEKAVLVDRQHRILVRQMLNHKVAYNIAQGTNPCGPRSPVAATGRDRQLPPRASNRSCAASRRAGRPGTDQSQSRSCSNNGRIRYLISQSDAAHTRKRILNQRHSRPRCPESWLPIGFRTQGKRQL
jgi:hypothetical protein